MQNSGYALDDQAQTVGLQAALVEGVEGVLVLVEEIRDDTCEVDAGPVQAHPDEDLIPRLLPAVHVPGNIELPTGELLS